MSSKLICYKGTKTPCRTCGGTMKCPKCDGEGEIHCGPWSYKDCPRCGVTGRCDECGNMMDGVEAVPIREIFGDDESKWPLYVQEYVSE